MRLKMEKISIILLVLLFIPQVLLALGDVEQINTIKKDREVWSARSKELNKYLKELSETSLDLTGIAEDSEDKQLQYAAECVIDISNVVGLLETVYTLNANCSQTCLTIHDLYKQNLRALGHTSGVIDYKAAQLNELFNKVKDDNALRLLSESIKKIGELKKILAEQNEYIFLRLKETKK